MPRTGLSAIELREKAIEHAITRMRQQGFERVRLSDIARDLGVSHAALYSHFSDKSALLDAVSERWLNQLDEIQEAFCRNSDSLPLERLKGWFLNLHRQKRQKVLNDPELYKAFNYSAEMMKPFVKRHLDVSHRQVKKMLEQAVQANQLPGVPLENATRLLLTGTIGFHHPKLIQEQLEFEREEALINLLDTLLAGLQNQNPV